MATAAATSGNPKHNGGVIKGVRLGFDANGPLVANDVGYVSPLKKSSVPHDGADAAEAVSAGTFGYDPPAGTILLKGYTRTIGGIGNDALRSGGSDFGQLESIHAGPTTFKTTRIAKAIRDGHWNEFSASWNTSPTTANDTFNSDNEATVNRASQGEFSLNYGAAGPTQFDHTARVG